MATAKSQLLDALTDNEESPEDIEAIFYQPAINCETGEIEDYPGWNGDLLPDPVSCTIDQLPEREFDNSFGAPEGEPVIAFTRKYIYICIQYDGSEWMEAIPRHPQYVKKPIPWPGG